jgi:outer membrane receptor for ferrienterochelin and colicin
MLSTAVAQNAAVKSPDDDQAELQEIVVTGSLIPTKQINTFTPVETITAEDIQAKGFADVAEALQRLSISTGAVYGAQAVGSYTQGATVKSFFGLDPSYTKYLFNGLPFANYPELYNGTVTMMAAARTGASPSAMDSRSAISVSSADCSTRRAIRSGRISGT